MIAGSPSNDLHILSRSQRIFTRLLALYPYEYRQEYGPQMAQLFKDCSREAVGQNGGTALLSLWIATLLDLFKTAFEEHFKELTHMSKEKFMRLGDWALIVGAICLAATLAFGNAETSFADPLGGRDAWVEYFKLGAGPLSMLLLATGALALRTAYGNEAGAPGNAALGVSVAAAVAAAVGAVGLGLLLPGEIWWTLFFLGFMLHLLGMGVFGALCWQRGALPGLNWLLAAGGLALPVLTLVGIVIQIVTDSQFYAGVLIFGVPLGLALLAYLAAGRQLLRAPALKAKTAG